MADRLFARNQIPSISTTHISVEEISTKILVDLGLRDHLR